MMKQKINSRWLIFALCTLVVGFLIMMNSFGYRTMSFDLKKSDTNNLVASNAVSYTPHLTYPKGEYTLNIVGNGNIKVDSADGTSLGEGKAGTDFNITLSKDESDIVISGDAASTLSKVKVSKDGMLYNDLTFLALLMILFMLYIGYLRFLKKDNVEESAVLLIVFVAAIFASYPLFWGTVGFGHDLNFHLYRIEGIKDGLLSGQFPVRIHPTHNNGYGYITASLYPELFLYPSAILRIFGISPVMSYNIFLFAVNIATAFIMYYSAKGISKSKFVGIVASIIYTLSTWRVMNLYYRAAVGEALAMVFFPLVIYGLYCLLKGDKKKWWVLALACTGVFQSHIISTVFVALTIFIFVIMSIKDFLKEQRWFGFVKTGILTLLLNLWYLVPFVKYYTGLDMAIKSVKENTEFFGNAIFPTELFNMFNTTFGYSQLIPVGIRGNMSLSLGVVVSICVVICVSYFIFRKKCELKNEKYIFGVVVFGLLLVFMSTTLFPWEILQKNKIINMFCGTIRMPWRFLSLASPLFCIAAAMIVWVRCKSDLSKKIIIMITCLISFVPFITWGTAYTTQNDPALKKGYAVSISGSVGLDKEYFILGTAENNLTANKYNASDGCEVTSHEKNGTNIKFDVSNAGKDSWVEVPLLYYPGYSAKDNNGEKLEVIDGNNHVLRVKLNYDTNQVVIKYSGFWYFKISTMMSIITAIFMLAIWIFNRRSKQIC